MSAASHPVVSLIYPCLCSNFCIFFCLPSYQLGNSGVEMLAPWCLKTGSLIHLKCEHCPTFFRVVLSAFRQKSLSTSSGCTANGFLKRQGSPEFYLVSLSCDEGCRYCSTWDWSGEHLLSQTGQVSMCREWEHCRDANQLSSVTCTPVKTVWLCVSWTLIFLSPCLLI